MGMDHLWAPWRLSYVTVAKDATEQDPCFICRGLGESSDRANLLALRTDHSAVYLNRFPYNNGHLLVAPRRHKGELSDLQPEEVLDTQATLARLIGVLRDLMKPDGFNVGLNLGKVAG